MYEFPSQDRKTGVQNFQLIIMNLFINIQNELFFFNGIVDNDHDSFKDIVQRSLKRDSREIGRVKDQREISIYTHP